MHEEVQGRTTAVLRRHPSPPQRSHRCISRWSMQTCVALLAVLLGWPVSVAAYESDVHYGLTRWLALKAGFDPGQADAIALGNQRLDGGLVDTLTMSAEIACEAQHSVVAAEHQQRHYPAAKAVPAAAVDREVQPGSAAARKSLAALHAMLPGKESLLLAKLGEAMHPLQDSWAHRGPPGVLASWGPMSCDSSLLSLHGPARGGPDSHNADLTSAAPADVLAAARASYQVLLDYPAVMGKLRRPAEFEALVPALERFARADTKAAKAQWFADQKFPDVSFLAGTTLPDGARPFTMVWNGRKLPPLEDDASQQHDADTSLRNFFNSALARWFGSDNVDAVAADLAGVRTAPELALKLKLWAMRDHGSAAALIHGPWPLRGDALARAQALTRSHGALVRAHRLSQVVLPFQALMPYATPLLPYVTRRLPPSPQGNARAVALLRLIHAPYDTVAIFGEQRNGRWLLTDVVGKPDH